VTLSDVSDVKVIQKESPIVAVQIYYFSGTGNCVAVARAIAMSVGTSPVSIPEVVDSPTISTPAETVGIVFPAYLAPLYGVPLIVDRFVRRLDGIRSKHLFAVCSCGGYEIVNAVRPLKNLAKLVRSLGGRLFAEYSVRLPMNNLDYDHIPIPIERDSGVIIEKSKVAIADICTRITLRKREKHHLVRSLVNFILIPMNAALARPCLKSLSEMAEQPADSHLGFRELVPLTDRSITLDENCTGCATCTRVCPVHNILMVNDKPEWQHRCEMCLACDEWCPHKAIHHWCRANGVKYHHPAVSIKDMYTTDPKPGL